MHHNCFEMNHLIRGNSPNAHKGQLHMGRSFLYTSQERARQCVSLSPGASKAARSPYDEESRTVVKEAKQFISDGLEWKRIHPVSMMIQHHRTRLLHHPLTKAWLVSKWNLYISYIFLVLLFIELLFVTSLTIFMAKTE